MRRRRGGFKKPRRTAATNRSSSSEVAQGAFRSSGENNVVCETRTSSSTPKGTSFRPSGICGWQGHNDRSTTSMTSSGFTSGDTTERPRKHHRKREGNPSSKPTSSSCSRRDSCQGFVPATELAWYGSGVGSASMMRSPPVVGEDRPRNTFNASWSKRSRDYGLKRTQTATWLNQGQGQQMFVWVVGRGYRPKHQAGLEVNQELLLIHDRNNEHDRNAVGVHTQSDHGEAGPLIGYLERVLARRVCPLLRSTDFSIQIVEIPSSETARLPCLLSWKPLCHDTLKAREARCYEELTTYASSQSKTGKCWEKCLAERLPNRPDGKSKAGTKRSTSSNKLRQQTLFCPLRKKSKREESRIPLIFPDATLKIMFFHLDYFKDFIAASLVCKQWLRLSKGFMPNRTLYLYKDFGCLKNVVEAPNLSGLFKNLSLISKSKNLGNTQCWRFGFSEDQIERLKEICITISTRDEKVRMADLIRNPNIMDRMLDRIDKDCLKDFKKSENPIEVIRNKQWNGLVSTTALLFSSSPSLIFTKINQIVALCNQSEPLVPRHLIVDFLYFISRVSQQENFSDFLRPVYELDSALESLRLDFPVSEGSVKLTGEQARIIRTNINGKQIMKVIACAGSGKTTLLRAYARARPNKEFIYITYNASVGKEAQRTFPPNVTCRNIHKIAYKKIGWSYRKKLRGEMSFTYGAYGDLTTERLVQKVVQAYLISRDKEINADHVEKCVPIYLKKKTDYLTMAKKYWKAMVDKGDEKVAMTHDGYLKLYMLSRPDLTRDYDILLLDEGQDCNEVLCEIVLNQNMPKFIVGDPNQQIYSFLGGKGVLENLQADFMFHLTKSFRFGPTLAFCSSMFLLHFKQEEETGENSRNVNQAEVSSLDGRAQVSNVNNGQESLRASGGNTMKDHQNANADTLRAPRFLFGVRSKTTQIHTEESHNEDAHNADREEEKIRDWITKRHTCICRSNAMLFAEAAIYIMGENAWSKLPVGHPCRKNKTIGFIGGIEAYNFDAIMDVYHLLQGEYKSIKKRNIKRFSKSVGAEANPMQAYRKLMEHARATEDADLLVACAVARRYGDDVPLIIRRIHSSYLKDERSAQLVLTTAHKAKGLEWDNVRLSDDFTDPLDEVVQDRLPVDEFGEEVNIIYVAMTRAKKNLWLNKALSEWANSIMLEDTDATTAAITITKEWNEMKRGAGLP